MLLKKLLNLSASLVVATVLLMPGKALACYPEQYIGSLCLFGGNFTIRNYAKADGQLLPISQNQSLFSILGTTYGGDGRTTFGLPDLRGRAPIGTGSGPGLMPVSLGQKGGAQSVTLSMLNMPAHSHSAETEVNTENDTSASTAALRALAARASTNDPTGAVLANSPRRENIYDNGLPIVDMSADAIVLDVQVASTSTATTAIGNAGGNQSFSVQDPYLGMTWLVALQGLFPPRN